FLSNAGRQARRAAGARHERTLAAVACTPWLGAGRAGTRCSPALAPHASWGFACRSRQRAERFLPLSLSYRPFPLYPFSSFFSSLKKRQSVPWARIFCGLLLIIPTSCRRRA